MFICADNHCDDKWSILMINDQCVNWTWYIRLTSSIDRCSVIWLRLSTPKKKDLISFNLEFLELLLHLVFSSDLTLVHYTHRILASVITPYNMRWLGDGRITRISTFLFEHRETCIFGNFSLWRNCLADFGQYLFLF